SPVLPGRAEGARGSARPGVRGARVLRAGPVEGIRPGSRAGGRRHRREGLLPGERRGRGHAHQARARRVLAREALRRYRLRLRLVASLHVQLESASPGRGRRPCPSGAVGEEVAAVSVAYTWGTQEAERRLPFPCDSYVPEPDAAYFRAVTV